jgi:hypothetical protein
VPGLAAGSVEPYSCSFWLGLPLIIGSPRPLIIYIYIHYPTTGYQITYSVATLSYDNCYVNLRDYSNSLLCDLL